MADSWKLWAAIGVLMFGAGFLFIFFFGSTIDYVPIGGSESATGGGICDMLPRWMCPPAR